MVWIVCHCEIMVGCQNIFILGDIKRILLIALKCRHDMTEGVEEPFKMLRNTFYRREYTKNYGCGVLIYSILWILIKAVTSE